MGVIDKVTDRITAILPSRRSRHEAQDDVPPLAAEVLALRDNIDGWLGKFFQEPWGFSSAGQSQLLPHTSVQENDTEFVIRAEMPGLDAADVDLTIGPGRLIVRGERRQSAQDTRNDGVISTESYESFVRAIPLPPNLDVERAEARVERGVLTVRFPKVDARPSSRRIPIRT